jgi:hypothetical protein
VLSLARSTMFSSMTLFSNNRNVLFLVVHDPTIEPDRSVLDDPIPHVFSMRFNASYSQRGSLK